MSKNSTPGKIPLWRTFLGGCLLLSVSTGVCIGLNMLGLGASVTFVATLAVSAGLGWAGSKVFGEPLFVLGFVSVAVALVSGNTLSEYIQTKDGLHIEGISVSDAARHDNVSSYSFDDGRIEPKFIGVHVETRRDSDSNRTTTSRWFVAPLVSEAWEEDDPVTIWVICPSGNSREECEEYFESELPRSAVVLRGLAEKWNDAVRNAEERHSLRTARGAPTIELVDDPRAAIQKNQLIGLATLFGGMFLLLIVLIVWGLIGRSKKKNEEN